MAFRMEAARAAVPFAIAPILALTLMGCGGGGGSPTPAPTSAPTAPPTPVPTVAPTPVPSPKGMGCMCVFDIDRTLTGAQEIGSKSPCTKNLVKPGIHDRAYKQGDLTLSEAAQNLKTSGCKECWIGVISAGGPEKDEQAELYKHLTANEKMPADVTNDKAWGRCAGDGVVDGSFPFYTSCTDGGKQKIIPFIKKFYESKEIYVDADEIYFFDDRENNVSPFNNADIQYNAKQISCTHRDSGPIGLCGAELAEITLDKSKTLCKKVLSEEIV